MTKKQISQKIWTLLINNNRMTVTQLAIQIDKSRTWTSLHVNGHLQSPDTCAAIAAALGVEVENIWGENSDCKRAA